MYSTTTVAKIPLIRHSQIVGGMFYWISSAWSPLVGHPGSLRLHPLCLPLRNRVMRTKRKKKWSVDRDRNPARLGPFALAQQVFPSFRGSYLCPPDKKKMKRVFGTKEKWTNEWGRDGHGQTSNGSMFFLLLLAGWVTNDYLKGKE